MTRSYTTTSLFLVVATMALFATTEGWSSPKIDNNGVSRRKCMEGVVAGALGISFLPAVASADVTNKVASPAALRSVKRAQKQLKDLLPVTERNDFVQVKAVLRTPPFSDVRKNCFVIVRGGDDGPKADELQSTYKAFIASIEKIDSTASLGIRGRAIPQMQLSEEYKAVESSMREFVIVAEAANEIPVQNEE